jgi:inhibitor of KinA sporulation pathway (predicted exonuclease)
VNGGKRLYHVVNRMLNHGLRNKVCLTWGDDGKELKKALGPEYYEHTRLDFTNFLNVAWMFKNMVNVDRSYSVESALAHFGLTFEGTPHRALDDAVNTARIYVEMLRRMRNIPCPA